MFTKVNDEELYGILQAALGKQKELSSNRLALRNQSPGKASQVGKR
jgi:hypothetical protein